MFFPKKALHRVRRHLEFVLTIFPAPLTWLCLLPALPAPLNPTLTPLSSHLAVPACHPIRFRARHRLLKFLPLALVPARHQLVSLLAPFLLGSPGSKQSSPGLKQSRASPRHRHYQRPRWRSTCKGTNKYRRMLSQGPCRYLVVTRMMFAFAFA